MLDHGNNQSVFRDVNFTKFFTRNHKYQINSNDQGFRCQVSGFRTDGGFSVQISASMFLFPDTRHLTPETLRFGACDLGF